MQEEFIKGKLSDDYKIQVTVPGKKDILKTNNIIYNELIVGDFKESSKETLLNIIKSFDNIEGVILGCTEPPLIIKSKDTILPLFDTTLLHANAAVDFAIKV